MESYIDRTPWSDGPPWSIWHVRQNNVLHRPSASTGRWDGGAMGDHFTPFSA